MFENPLMYVVMAGVAGYFFYLWLSDLRAFNAGTPNEKPLPGATPAPTRAIVIAVAGALLILLAETLGEYALGISAEQKTITMLFGVYTLSAAVIEEIVFRGYIVVTNRGKIIQWLAAFGASIVFAVAHPFLWEWVDATETESSKLIFHFTAKAWFSTGAIFVGSLWFYAVRFATFNPQQSLLPCFAAHAAKNAGVFVIKAAQGFVSGVW